MNMKNWESAEDFTNELLKDPEVKREYDRLAPRYALIHKLIEARIKKKFTQKELAEHMNTKQSAIARFESGEVNPTFDFAQKLAEALKTSITVTFHA